MPRRAVVSLLLAVGVAAVPARSRAAPNAPVDIVVTAEPPVDGQRLADALRAYLDEFGIRVDIAEPAAAGDLRRQLTEARHIGEAVRAVAVVRAQHGAGTGPG